VHKNLLKRLSLLILILSTFSISPAHSEAFFQEIELSLDYADVTLALDSEEGLACKPIAKSRFTCQFSFNVAAYFFTEVLDEESIAQEIGELEFYILEKRNNTFEKSLNFTSDIAYVSDILSPQTLSLSLRGDVQNPKNLKVTVRPMNSNVSVLTQLEELPVLNLDSSEINPLIQPSRLSPWPKLYEELGANGDWRDSRNRLENGLCEFGHDDSFGEKYFCSEITWVPTDKSDGFSKKFQLTIEAVDDQYRTSVDSNMIISCNDKKLNVGIRINDPGFSTWSGSGLNRFDNGTARKFKYRMNQSFDYIWLDEPKLFTANFLKSQSKVSFKISDPSPNIFVFPKSSLSKYANKFKSAGCPIK
jgi:hypothetical protein